MRYLASRRCADERPDRVYGTAGTPVCTAEHRSCVGVALYLRSEQSQTWTRVTAEVVRSGQTCSARQPLNLMKFLDIFERRPGLWPRGGGTPVFSSGI